MPVECLSAARGQGQRPLQSCTARPVEVLVDNEIAVRTIKIFKIRSYLSSSNWPKQEYRVRFGTPADTAIARQVKQQASGNLHRMSTPIQWMWSSSDKMGKGPGWADPAQRLSCSQ